MKHIDIRHYFLKVTFEKIISLKFVNMENQLADILLLSPKRFPLLEENLVLVKFPIKSLCLHVYNRSHLNVDLKLFMNYAVY